MSEQEMTRSECPICGETFPHQAGYKPVTCGKLVCLQEAFRREAGIVNTQNIRYQRGLLILCSQERDKAEAELNRVLKEDGAIADNMRSTWANQANHSAR